MKRFLNFFFGLIVGCTLMFVGLKYHVVRASDGFHFVPKSRARLASVYADLRTFTMNDWRNRQDLLVDITNSNDHDLKELVARSTFTNQLGAAWDGTWDRLGNRDLP